MKNYTKIIETERLILRKFKLEDADDMFNNYANSKNVCEYLTWKPHKNIEDTISYLTNIVLPEYDVDYTYRWAIVLKDINQVVGCIDVVNKDVNKKMAELGYCLGDKFWGKGIMTEAGEKVIEYLLQENFVRIQAKHDVRNSKSGRVMQKIGMQYEGTLRKCAIDGNGEFVDCKLYSIVKEQK